MHPGQKYASDSGQTYAPRAETCLRFRADLCTLGRNMPRIQGIIFRLRNGLPEFLEKQYRFQNALLVDETCVMICQENMPKKVTLHFGVLGEKNDV